MSHALQPAAPQPARSEGLLPADAPDPNLEIAEEVAFDLQSDQARAVGAMAPDTPVSKPAEALQQALQPEPGGDAVPDRAVPPAV